MSASAPLPTPTATCVHGDASAISEILTAEDSSGVRLIAAAAAPADDPLLEWFVKPAAATIEWLRRLDDSGQAPSSVVPIVVLWAFPPATTPAENDARTAAFESLRGIVQSVTREEAGHWPPVNGIAARLDDLASALAAIAFLGHPDGAFTAGATLDLISSREQGAA